MNQLAEFLKKEFLRGLPGAEAQRIMAPNNRLATPEYLKNLSVKPRLSAVMLMLFPGRDNRPSLLLIERPNYEGVHSGQIALPGGKMEDTDESLEHTALREMREETGFDGVVEILGKLSEVYIPPSNYLVTPFVAHIISRPIWKPDEREVAGMIEAPLESLNDDLLVGKGEFITSSKYKVLAPYFIIQGHKIWGATAIMLSEFREILRKGWF